MQTTATGACGIARSAAAASGAWGASNAAVAAAGVASTRRSLSMKAPSAVVTRQPPLPPTEIGAISAARATRRRLPSIRASAAGSSPRPSGNETGRPSPRPPRLRRISARRTLPCSRSIAATRGRALRTDSAAASPAKTPISAGAAARSAASRPKRRATNACTDSSSRPRATNGSAKRRSFAPADSRLVLNSAGGLAGNGRSAPPT